MKKVKIAVCIILCLILSLNLVPVYGQDNSVTEEIENIIESTEENADEQETDITEEPEQMPLTPPAGLKSILTSEGYIKTTWNKVYGATGYEVYRSPSKDGTYKLLSTVAGNYYVDKSVYRGAAFYYKIKTVNKDNPAINSEMSSSTVYYMKPATPVVKTKNSNGNITISWNKIYGAQKYYVYVYSTKKKQYLKVGESSGLTYTHKKAVKNTFLYYKVRAVYAIDGKVVAGNCSKSSKILSRYVDPDKKMVALTFDDGPSKYTKSIVKCLYKYDSAATFFVVGNRVNSYKDTIAYTYNMGSELANHSYSHPLLTKLSSDSIKSQIRKTDNRIKAITGEKTALVRVPYGGHNEKVRKAVGKPLIQWSDDTLDWKTRSKKATVNYVMKNVQDGDIILMHDIHEPTKNAALELIPKLRAKGYQIVTVSELAKYKGYKLKNGKAYSSFR